MSQSHWSLLHLGNKPKKFDFIHQTVRHARAGHETRGEPGTPNHVTSRVDIEHNFKVHLPQDNITSNVVGMILQYK